MRLSRLMLSTPPSKRTRYRTPAAGSACANLFLKLRHLQCQRSRISARIETRTGESSQQERAARIEQQENRLIGIDLRGEAECSFQGYNLVMAKEDVISNLPPNKFQKVLKPTRKPQIVKPAKMPNVALFVGRAKCGIPEPQNPKPHFQPSTLSRTSV